METEELIEHILRQKHLEEMMNRPEKEHTPLEGMDNEQIKRFALFLFEENQNKSKQLDEMIARLDEIGKDLKDANRKIDSLTDALLKANSKAEKAAIECKLRDKEYKKLEKKHNALVERLSLMNNQTYASSKSLKGIDRKKGRKKESMTTRMTLTELPLLRLVKFHSQTLPHHATRRILRPLLFPRKDRIEKE